MESLVISKESLFLKNFIDYWKIIRKHRPEDISRVNETCALLYPKYTKPFIDKWKDQIFIINISDEYIKNYHSFELTVRSGLFFLIPHILLVFETLRPKGQMYQHIDKIKTLKEFLFYLQRSCRDMNLKLNKSDVLILKKLTSNEFIGLSTRVPTFEEMAEFCGIHRNTFANRINKLLDTYILAIIYKVDPSIIGYETIVTINEYEETLDDFYDYHLATNPINYGFCFKKKPIKYRLFLCQIPMNKPEIYYKIRNRPNTLLFQPLSNEYIGWNLNSLTPDIKNRWEMLPPILSVHSWDEGIKAKSNGITLDLLPDPQNTINLTPIDSKMLDMYAIHNMIEDIEVAKKLNVTEKYVRESRLRLLNAKLIKLFVYASSIGATFKPWITVIGQNIKSHVSIMENIVEHLKFFPFARLFYDLVGSRKIITGYLFMPEFWVNDFLYKWSELSNYGLKTDLNLSYSRQIKWSINMTNTYLQTKNS